jgi:hypothetical protein
VAENERGQVTIGLGWLGFIATGVAQVVAFTFFLARLESGLSEVRTDIAGQSAQVSATASDIRRLELQIQYLCNERRRDNQEAGRNGGNVC